MQANRQRGEFGDVVIFRSGFNVGSFQIVHVYNGFNQLHKNLGGSRRADCIGKNCQQDFAARRRSY